MRIVNPYQLLCIDPCKSEQWVVEGRGGDGGHFDIMGFHLINSINNSSFITKLLYKIKLLYAILKASYLTEARVHFVQVFRSRAFEMYTFLQNAFWYWRSMWDISIVKGKREYSKHALKVSLLKHEGIISCEGTQTLHVKI